MFFFTYLRTPSGDLLDFEEYHLPSWKKKNLPAILSPFNNNSSNGSSKEQQKSFNFSDQDREASESWSDYSGSPSKRHGKSFENDSTLLSSSLSEQGQEDNLGKEKDEDVTAIGNKNVALPSRKCRCL